MSGPQQGNPTEDQRVYGAFGLAVLIAEVATERANAFSGCRIRRGDIDSGPLPRGESDGWPASSGYYQICDRIARGEAL